MSVAAERTVRQALLELLQKAQGHRAANRLIGFLLFAAGLYLLLLLAILLFGLPLLVFHLLLFTGLSLFPLFLFPAAETWNTIEVLRRIDEHCQIEAYLATASAEHRGFLEDRVRTLLRRRKAERALRFRLPRINRFLAVAAGGLFLLLQLASLATLQSLPPVLSPGALKTMQARGQPALRGAQQAPLQPSDARRGEVSEAGSAAKPGGSPRTEGRLRRQEDYGEPGTAPDLPGADAQLATPAEQEATAGGESAPWVPLPHGEGGLGPALKGTTEAGPEGDRQQGRLPAGVGEAGKALIDSPLREYSASRPRESIETSGGTRLAAEPGRAPFKEQEVLRQLFADFPALELEDGGFDPAIERIRRRYMELLNERY